jgi:SNF2 family DNA or RNA helicase
MNQKLRYHYKTEPFSHQKRALAKILKLNGVAALFMEMGTGKTKVAIDWAGISATNFHLKRVLVICPVSVLGVWDRQIKAHCPIPSRVTILSGSTTERLITINKNRQHEPGTIDWFIINYEAIWRENDEYSLIDQLISWLPDLVIADESHRLKSPTARQSKAAWQIGRHSKSRLVLTGSPITKTPLDLFGQFRFLDSKIVGTSWYQFKNRYAIFGGFGKYQIKGYKNLKELVEKTRATSFRIKKEQCLDLPEKLFLDVPVTLSEEAQKIYRTMAKEMIVEIEDTEATAAIVLVKLLRLSQITSGFVKDVEGQIRVFDDSKLRTTMDLLEDVLANDEKVVIFTRFRKDISRLAVAAHERFKRAPLILSGSVPSDRRDSIVQEFHENPKKKIFIAQIQAGSLGIDLTPASVAIFYSLDYNYANYIQAVDRLHRIGQTRPVTYYHLMAERTIDHVVLQSLRDKGNLAEAIIHNPQVLFGDVD